MIKGSMRGASALISNLRRIADKYPDHVAAAIFQEAQIEMTEMKRRTPVDTRPNRAYPNQRAPHPGQLRASGTVHRPERRGKNISVTMSFGGAARDYAIHVHENPDAIHPVGQWKYMESVLNESRAHMGARLARRVHFNRMRK